MATSLKTGLMNTDIHVGNFIFCSGGKVAFIEFGRTKRVETKNIDQLLKEVIRKDLESAKRLLPSMFPAKRATSKDEVPFAAIWSFFLSQQTQLHQGEFRFTREHIAETHSDAKVFPYRKQIQLSMDKAWSMSTSMGLWSNFRDLDVAVNLCDI